MEAFLANVVGKEVKHLETFLLLSHTSTDVSHTSILRGRGGGVGRGKGGGVGRGRGGEEWGGRGKSHDTAHPQLCADRLNLYL